jgi:hypothetical protein
MKILRTIGSHLGLIRELLALKLRRAPAPGTTHQPGVEKP